MKPLLFIFILFSLLTSCYFEANVKTKQVYQQYFEEETWEKFQSALKLFQQKDEREKALLLLNQIIKESKNNLNNRMPVELNPYYYRAHILYGRGDYQECISDFNNVITDTTSDTEIYIEIASAFQNIKQPEKAIKNCNIVLSKFDKNDPIAFYIRGVSYLDLSDTVSACHDFTSSQKAGIDSLAIEPYKSLCK